MTENALVPVNPISREITPESWKMINSVAQMAIVYGWQPEAMAIVALRGWELGFTVSASLEVIYAIPSAQGIRTAVSATAMKALINRSGVLESFKREDKPGLDNLPYSCTVTMVRRDGTSYAATFTMDDAVRAGLAGKDNWTKYPKTMLYNRALTECARTVCPEIITGLYTPDELGVETDQSGKPVTVDTTWTAVDDKESVAEIARYPEPADDLTVGSTLEQTAQIPLSMDDLQAFGYTVEAILAITTVLERMPYNRDEADKALAQIAAKEETNDVVNE